MRRPEWLALQASHPRGLVGCVLARIMASETAQVNEHTLALLHIQPTDRVLEVGCGHGRTLARAAAVARQGIADGIDVSADMMRMATQWNRPLIQEGRVKVQHADSAQIPYGDESFARVYAVHTLYFWDDPRAHLQELYRVMKDDVRLVLGFRSCEDHQAVANFPSTIYRFYIGNEVSEFLNDVGFHASKSSPSASDHACSLLALHTERPHSGALVLYTCAALVRRPRRMSPLVREAAPLLMHQSGKRKQGLTRPLRPLSKK